MFVVAVFLSCQEDAYGQEISRDSLLLDDINAYVSRAHKDRIISKEKSDSIMKFINDSLPSSQDLRISILMDIRDEIDRLYDEYLTRLDELASSDYTYMASSMLPTLLHEPEGLPDPFKERRKAELEAVMRTKELAAMHFEQQRCKIPGWALFVLKLLFNAGMDTSGKSMAVYQGLYYIDIPGGQPQPEPWTATVPKTTD